MWDKGTSSNIIGLDIDYPRDLYALKMDCREIPSVVGYFDSPSGKGLKVFMLVSTFGQTLEDFKSIWKQAVDYFEARTKNTVDLKCKNISRICYYSWDPYLYINSFPIAFQVDPEIKFLSEKPKAAPTSKTYTTSISNKVQDFLIRHTEQKFGLYTSGRNNFIYCLACNCNRYGLDIDRAKSICETLYNSDLGPLNTVADFERTIKSAYSHTGEHGKLKLQSA
jgi:hypothetical protein